MISIIKTSKSRKEYKFYLGGGGGGARVMVFNANLKNISVISWQSVLLVKETGENHRPATIYRQALSHKVALSMLRHERNSNSQRQW